MGPLIDWIATSLFGALMAFIRALIEAAQRIFLFYFLD